MPTAPDGVSWIVWLIAIIATPLLGATASIIVALITRRDTKAELADAKTAMVETKAGVDETLEQVRNTHTSNLREDLDEKFEAVGVRLDNVVSSIADVRTDVGGLHSETRDLRKDVTGIRDDARRDRRKLSAQEQALDDHLADVPRILDEAFAKHVSDCPVRQLPQ